MSPASFLRHIGVASLAMAAIVALPEAAPARSVPTRDLPAPPAFETLGERQLFLSLPVGGTLGRYFANLREDFFALDADGDGKITQRDVDLHALMESTQRRTAAWNAIMRFDLDGDGFVSEDEVRRVWGYEMRADRVRTAVGNGQPGGGRELIEKYVRSILELDTDKDGRVSLAEASKFSQSTQQGNMQAIGYAVRTRDVLTLGTDGELSLANYQAAGEILFRKVDTDNDWKISAEEYTSLWPESGAPRLDAAETLKWQREQAAKIAREWQVAVDAHKVLCALPPASAQAKVVLFSSTQTASLSSVTMGSQDVVVFAGRIVIEPGAEPLYIVIPTASPVIWQFSGAVDRVERLILTSDHTLPGKTRYDPNQPGLAGATGLPRDKVSFPAKVGCLNYFTEVPSGGSIAAVHVLRQTIGQEPFKVAGAYSVRGVRLPSGTIEPEPEDKRLVIEKGSGTLRIEGDVSDIILRSGPSHARDDLHLYHPGGLVEIDPKSVVSTYPAEAYEVYPQEAGLVQLLQSGALTQNQRGEYIVRKKMRFPTGLSGAHSVKFLVLRGTPVPDGDPGHSCVSLEEPQPDRKFVPCR
jgi:Ca2+-binding EF-hand superfamily protein